MNNIALSETDLTEINQISQKLKLSVSELIDGINQGKLTIVSTEKLEDLMDLRDAILAESDPENQEKVSWENIKNKLGL